MEYIRKIKVSIEKDTNKATTEIILMLGEYDEDETVEQFSERVKECLNEILLSE